MWLDAVRTGGRFRGCALQALELYETLGTHGLVATSCPVDITGIVQEADGTLDCALVQPPHFTL